MYLCMYVCMYVQFEFLDKILSICTMYVCMYVCMYVGINIYTVLIVYIDTNMHVCMDM